jgi:hypothetical protein
MRQIFFQALILHQETLSLLDLHASFCAKMRQKEKIVFGFSFVLRSDNSVFFSTLEAVFCRVKMGDDDVTLSSSSYKA